MPACRLLALDLDLYDGSTYCLPEIDNMGRVDEGIYE